MTNEPLGVTQDVDDNVDAIGVYESDDGIEVFETDEPYLMSDGVTLVDPVPVILVDGPSYRDKAGNLLDAIAVYGLYSGPVDIFQEGDLGGIWGKIPYFLDTAGNPEATWGDPVAGIPDALSEEVDWQQPTSTARPILGRVPRTGRRNLLTWTEDLTRTPWAKHPAIVVTKAQDGWFELTRTEMGGGIYFYQAGLPTTGVGEIYTTVWTVRAGTSDRATILLHRGIAASPSNTHMRKISGPGEVSGVSDIRVSGLSPTEDTVLQVSRRIGVEESPGIILTPFFYPVGGGSSDPTGSVLVKKPIMSQLESLADYPPPYQRVTNEYDITEEGVESISFLHFNGIDDFIPRIDTYPAGTYTVAIAGTNGTWVDTFEWEGGTFQVGVDTYSGGPAGIIPILGDLLVEGCFFINREITQSERDLLIKYYGKLGSPGVIEQQEIKQEFALATVDSGEADYDEGADFFHIKRAGGGIGSVVYGELGTPVIYAGNYETLTGDVITVRDNNSPFSNASSSLGFKRNRILQTTSGMLKFNHGASDLESTFRIHSLRRLIMPGETP